jgi:hypothetical protein
MVCPRHNDMVGTSPQLDGTEQCRFGEPVHHLSGIEGSVVVQMLRSDVVSGDCFHDFRRFLSKKVVPDKQEERKGSKFSLFPLLSACIQGNNLLICL